MFEAVSFPKYRKGDLVSFSLESGNGKVDFIRVSVEESVHVPGAGRFYWVLNKSTLVPEEALRLAPVVVDENPAEPGVTSLDDDRVGEKMDPEDIKLSLKDHYLPGQFVRVLGFTDDDGDYVTFEGMKVYGQICGLSAYDDAVEYYLTILGKSKKYGIGFFVDFASFDAEDVEIVAEDEVRQYEAFLLRGGDISSRPLLKVIG